MSSSFDDTAIALQLTCHFALPAAISATNAAASDNPMVLTLVSRSPDRTRASTIVAAG
jgi:hypothetical protein